LGQSERLLLLLLLLLLLRLRLKALPPNVPAYKVLLLLRLWFLLVSQRQAQFFPKTRLNVTAMPFRIWAEKLGHKSVHLLLLLLRLLLLPLSFLLPSFLLRLLLLLPRWT
jgi:hypothetical protein